MLFCLYLLSFPVSGLLYIYNIYLIIDNYIEVSLSGFYMLSSERLGSKNVRQLFAYNHSYCVGIFLRIPRFFRRKITLSVKIGDGEINFGWLSRNVVLVVGQVSSSGHSRNSAHY